MEIVKTKRPMRMGTAFIPVGSEIGLPENIAKIAIEQGMATPMADQPNEKKERKKKGE